MQVFTDTGGSCIFVTNYDVFVFRISSANFHPRKEFKPKSIRGALNVFDNSPHNSLSHSASIKSSGPGNTSLSHIWISFIFSSIFMVSQCLFLFLLSLTGVQINRTVSIRSRCTFLVQMCFFSPPSFSVLLDMNEDDIH